MRQRLKVLRVDPASEVWLQAADSGCRLCGKAVSCHNSAIRMPLEPSSELQVGAELEFSVNDRVLLAVAARVYLIPLLALLAGALVGRSLGDNELGSIGLAVLGLVLAVAWNQRHPVPLNIEQRPGDGF